MAYRAAWGIDGLAKELEAGMAQGVTASVTENTLATKEDVRGETRVAFKGNRLPNAWRSRVYPQGRVSVEAAGWVEVRRGAADIIDVASRGATIRARNGFWLAIPTAAAGKFGVKVGANGFGTTTNTKGARERITPAGYQRRTGLTLRFVYDGGRRAFLVVDQAQLTRGLASPYRSKGRGSKLYGPAGQTIVVFILVPQASMKKRMDLDAIAERAGNRGVGLLLKHWR